MATTFPAQLLWSMVTPLTQVEERHCVESGGAVGYAGGH